MDVYSLEMNTIITVFVAALVFLLPLADRRICRRLRLNLAGGLSENPDADRLLRLRQRLLAIGVLLYLLIFALIILVPGAILFFMLAGKGADMGMFLLIWLGIFAGVELLTILIYKAVEKAKGGSTDIPYLMNENFIVVHPGDRKTPEFYLRTDFSNVKDIRVDKENDLITLHELARVTHVYVHHEDFPFVLGFIFEHLPQTNKITGRKEQYKKYMPAVSES